MALKDVLNDTNIPAQKKYFRWYTRLPLIYACIILAIAAIWGIIDPCVFHFYGPRYGVMHLGSGILCWLMWFIIGAILAIIVYLTGKIVQSQKVLNTLYLQYLCEHNDTVTTKQEIKSESTPSNEPIEELDETQKELTTLKQLFEAGAISQQEYENKKKEILGI